MFGRKSQYEYNKNIWQIKASPINTQLLLENDKEMSNTVKYIINLEKINPEGFEPTPRTMQTALFYDKYIVTFGGRSDSENSYCLNDIVLFDLSLYKWQPIVIYGFIPSKRWGHTMVIDNNSLLIFGGVGEHTLSSSTIYTLTMDKKFVKDNLDECHKIKALLEIQAKNLNYIW